jgi:hypothetical protein
VYNIAQRSTAGRNKDMRPNMRIVDMTDRTKRKRKKINSRGNVDEEKYASNKKVHQGAWRSSGGDEVEGGR